MVSEKKRIENVDTHTYTRTTEAYLYNKLTIEPSAQVSYNALKESRVTLDNIHVKNAGMVFLVRHFVSEDTHFDSIYYYSKGTCGTVVKYNKSFTLAIQILINKAKTTILIFMTKVQISCKSPYLS